MNLRELLETAHLDALGLLDEQEQRDFEAAFNGATPGVRAQIRAEQARWARTAARFSEEEPPASLREKVLDRVGAAIEEASTPVAGTIAASGLAVSRETQKSTSQRFASSVLSIGVASRVSPLWRAASIGFATAAMVCLGVLLYQLDQTRRLGEEYVSDRVVGSLTAGLGSRYYEDVLFKSATHRVIFERTANASGGEASLFLNPDWETSRLFCQHLPPAESGRVYRVVILNEQNEIVGRPLREFTADGGLTSVGISATIAKGSRIAIASCVVGKATQFSDVLLIATIPTA